ncbi:MAG: methylated-DNA--[protein]-cysteine S-methyltransferase [Ekhidna sp.]|nr:methylated-DNA--[protein]-cysteine S-methyltransferase [Ekhidna sp.]
MKKREGIRSLHSLKDMILLTDSLKLTIHDKAFPAAEEQRIIINRVFTPLGAMVAGATDEGLCLLAFAGGEKLKNQIDALTKSMRAEIMTGQHPLIHLVSLQLSEYFEGKRKVFNVPFVMQGTAFQQKVWDALVKIPFGMTRSYKQQAKVVGNTRSVRAVARANGANRIAIIIPCHRVIGSDGSIVGYGGGVHRKQWLLKHEFEHQ